jgi:hypothetical protein
MATLWWSYFEPKERPKLMFRFSGWRSPEAEKPAYSFRCPVCCVDLRPQNVQCIVCTNCWHGGTKETFSAVVRAA